MVIIYCRTHRGNQQLSQAVFMFVLSPLGVLLSNNQYASDLHGSCILSFGTGRQEKTLPQVWRL